MPRAVSPHQPTFTQDQLAEARRLAHSQKAPHRAVLRARLTLVLAEHPAIKHEEAAARCGLQYSTVYKWRRRWAEAGWSLADAPRPGRPPVFSPRRTDPGESPGL